jgi:hypothetical protein
MKKVGLLDFHGRCLDKPRGVSILVGNRRGGP